MTTMRLLVLLLAVLVFSDFGLIPVLAAGPKKPAAADSQMEAPEIRDKWALLIGINRFVDPTVPALKFAQKSSADISRAIRDPDFGHFAPNHVLVLNGPDASKAAIEQAFDEWLYKKALPDDLVLIYINTRLCRNAGGEPVVCANDTQSAQPDKTGINLLELLTAARRRTGSPHILCLLDAHPLASLAEKSSRDLKWLSKTSGVTMFSAAELFQPSAEDPASMQTYFSHYFVEGLKSGGGNFPLAMLSEYVFQKVQETTKGSSVQAPVLSLPGEQTATIAIPLGVSVRSSVPEKLPAIGHKLDTLGLDRPDLVAPLMTPTRSKVILQSRKGNPPTVAAAGSAAKPPSPATTAKLPAASSVAAKPPAAVSAEAARKTTAPAASTDDEEDEFDPNLDLRGYVAKIKEDIQKKWQCPRGLTDRRVVTTFSIARDGRIMNASVVESSGNAEVDESALAALKSASPLMALPKGSPRSIDLKYAFDWKSTIQSHEK
jgi:TonB family protein